MIVESKDHLVFVDAKQANAMKLRQLRHQHKHQRNKVNEKVKGVELSVKSGDEKPAINGDYYFKTVLKSN